MVKAFLEMDYLGRQSRVAAALRAQKHDGALITHLPNVRYLCGFTGSAGVLAVSVDKSSHQCAFFSDGRYIQQAKEQVKGARVEIPKTAAISAAAGWLTKRKKGARVAFE